MKQALLTNIIMGILVVLNISLLAFVFMQKDKPEGPPRGDRNRRAPVPEQISRTLSFTPEQKENFKKLGRKHHEGLKDIEKELGETMRTYFLRRTEGATQEETAGQLANILEMEKEKILFTEQHFQDIKDICTEDQLENFPEVIDLIFNRLNRQGGRPGKGPRPPRQRPGP